MNIKKIYKKIIPPDTYKDRKDFYNEDLIDNLTSQEKVLIENMLIEDLKSRHDLLIIETLAYMKAEKSIEVIEKRLESVEEPFDKIIIAWFLYNLNKDKSRMVDIAYNNFLLINDDYVKTRLFYYLGKFKENKLNLILETYANNKNILLSENSKAALERQ
ncbi:hypothetical protein [Aquimarina algiphila]|uniref:hypothetical protein n=1 Tax=Aquimarina algiphila TaxID=2047982 RepID=UPI002331302D|nr:hypothetical protein [Aquimarina algiphila]